MKRIGTFLITMVTGMLLLSGCSEYATSKNPVEKKTKTVGEETVVVYDAIPEKSSSGTYSEKTTSYVLSSISNQL